MFVSLGLNTAHAGLPGTFEANVISDGYDMSAVELHLDEQCNGGEYTDCVWDPSTGYLYCAYIASGTTLHFIDAAGELISYSVCVDEYKLNSAETIVLTHIDNYYGSGSEGEACSCSTESNFCQTSCYDDVWMPVTSYDAPPYGGGYWSADQGHYDYRSVVSSCNASSSTCNKVPEFRCSEGWYGVAYADDEGGLWGCQECPEGACCGIAVDEYGTQSDQFEGINVFVSKTAESCEAYDVTQVFNGYQAGEIILWACGAFDTHHVSLVSTGYVRTELPLYSGECKPIGGLDSDMPDGYGCATDFRIVVKQDSGPATCSANQYRDYSTGKTVCKTCPAYNGVTGVPYDNDSSAFKNRLVDCEIPTTETFSDTIGTFKYSESCTMCTADI